MAEDTQHTVVAVRMDHTLGAELEVEHKAAGSTTELVVGQLQFPGLGVDLSEKFIVAWCTQFPINSRLLFYAGWCIWVVLISCNWEFALYSINT